jgi:hypothetical protein
MAGTLFTENKSVRLLFLGVNESERAHRGQQTDIRA